MARFGAGPGVLGPKVARLFLLLGSLQITAPTDRALRAEHSVASSTRVSTFAGGAAVFGGDAPRGSFRLRVSAGGIAAIAPARARDEFARAGRSKLRERPAVRVRLPAPSHSLRLSSHYAFVWRRTLTAKNITPAADLRDVGKEF
jgi:hypothetical protein